MKTLSEQIRIEIEATADILGIAPSTVGERAGQGGKFYQRMKDGKRVWPETADAVRKKMAEMMADVKHDISHERASTDIQGGAA